MNNKKIDPLIQTAAEYIINSTISRLRLTTRPRVPSVAIALPRHEDLHAPFICVCSVAHSRGKASGCWPRRFNSYALRSTTCEHRCCSVHDDGEAIPARTSQHQGYRILSPRCCTGALLSLAREAGPVGGVQMLVSCGCHSRGIDIVLAALVCPLVLYESFLLLHVLSSR